MPEKYLWFDDDLEHSAQDWADFHSGYLSNGVNVYENPDALSVVPAGGLSVKWKSGVAYINGRYYKLEEDWTISSGLSAPTQTIYGRFKIAVDLEQQKINIGLEINTTLPELIRNNTIYEISVAKIVIPTGTSTITSAMITDERSNRDVCGFLRFLGHEAERVPAGTVSFFAGTEPPVGWLVRDGSIISRSSYPDLFNAIGTLYGAGDGSTTFALPNDLDLFVRGSNGATNPVGTAQGATKLTYADDDLGVLRMDSNPDTTETSTKTVRDIPTSGSASWSVNSYTVRPKNRAYLPIIKY